MPLKPTKSRFVRMLRQTAKFAQASATTRLATEENSFWMSHERAVTRSREAAEAAQKIASLVAKQRASVDTLADRSRAVAGRAQELSTIFGRIGEVFDRLGLVALNAGLEGARLGESAGRAVLLVSDEVRTHSLRGGENVRELTATLAEMALELTQLNTSFEVPREASTEMAQQAALAAGAAADTERALAEIDTRIRKATGSDPETARAMAAASEHAHALLENVGILSGKVAHDDLMGTLRPMLAPLVRALEDASTERRGADLDDEAADEEPGE